MDFTVPDEYRMLQMTVRRFVQEELMPLEKENYELVPPEVVDALQAKLRALGLWALEVPKELGGADFTSLGMAYVMEERHKCILQDGGDTIFGGNAEPILLACADDDYQRENYLLPVIRGEKRPSFAQTEPNWGSDPASMETLAVLQGENYIINGTKIFIGRARRADFFLLLAKTDRTKGRAGVTCFLVDRDAPGFKIVREIPMMDGQRPCELSLEDCIVPVKNRIGQEGEGFTLGQRNLGRGRMRFGPAALGRSERALEMAVRYSKQRVTFGAPIATRQAIQWMLADSAIEMDALRWMTYHGCWMADQGMDIRDTAARVKVFSSETEGRVVDRSLQIHGAIGLSKDLPLERLYRIVRHARIGEGTVEMMRFVVARNLLRD